MYIANTTGYIQYGPYRRYGKERGYMVVIAAKACGKKNPTVGILNVDGARQTEKALKQLKDQGYDITFAESSRAGRRMRDERK